MGKTIPRIKWHASKINCIGLSPWKLYGPQLAVYNFNRKKKKEEKRKKKRKKRGGDAYQGPGSVLRFIRGLRACNREVMGKTGSNSAALQWPKGPAVVARGSSQLEARSTVAVGGYYTWTGTQWWSDGEPNATSENIKHTIFFCPQFCAFHADSLTNRNVTKTQAVLGTNIESRDGTINERKTTMETVNLAEAFQARRAKNAADLILGKQFQFDNWLGNGIEESIALDSGMRGGSR